MTLTMTWNIDVDDDVFPPSLHCIHGLPGPFLLSYSVFVFVFSFFRFMPCARLGWPSCQLLSARKYRFHNITYSFNKKLTSRSSIQVKYRIKQTHKWNTVQ